jgi:hypothetical protein
LTACGATVAVVVACSSTTNIINVPTDDGGGTTPDGAVQYDESGAPIDTGGGGRKDSPSSGTDSNVPSWNGTFGACPGAGSPTPPSNGCSCGTDRWSVKTGTDSQSVAIALSSPTTTTISALSALTPPSGGAFATYRLNSTEKTAYAIKDVNITHATLESDCDYHLVLQDPTDFKEMIVEIPYPAQCVDSSSPWACYISNARSTVDAKFTPSGHNPNIQYATVVGIGFFDDEHLSCSSLCPTGMAPNGIELHPVLGICFGKGCTP